MDPSDLGAHSNRRARRGRVSRPRSWFLVFVAGTWLVAFGVLSSCGRSNPSVVEPSESAKPFIGDDQESPLGDELVSQAALPALPETQYAKQLQEEISQGLNPHDVGWETEAFNDAASRQLKRLAQVLATPSRVAEGPPPDLLADDFDCHLLRPKDLVTAFHDSSTMVMRPSGQTVKSTEATLHGPQGLAVAARRLVETFTFGPRRPMKVTLKIVSVEAHGDVAETRIVADGGCQGKDGSRNGRRLGSVVGPDAGMMRHGWRRSWSTTTKRLSRGAKAKPGW